jgi:hypothetical protein
MSIMRTVVFLHHSHSTSINMLKITKVNIKHLAPTIVNIAWDLESTTEDLSNYEINIFQSETPTDVLADYTLIASGISPAYRAQYDDDSVTGLTNKFDTLVYRVQVRELATGDYKLSPAAIVTVHGDMNAKYIIRHRELVLNRLSGQKFIVLKKKTFGQYCTNCYDETLQRTTVGKCSICYGTGYVGGYYSPYTIHAQINENPPRQIITTYGDWQDQDALLVMSVSPTVMPGDVIIDLYHRRWVAISPRSTNKAMFTIAQQIQMRQIESDDIIYQFSVPSW